MSDEQLPAPSTDSTANCASDSSANLPDTIGQTFAQILNESTSDPLPTPNAATEPRETTAAMRLRGQLSGLFKNTRMPSDDDSSSTSGSSQAGQSAISAAIGAAVNGATVSSVELTTGSMQRLSPSGQGTKDHSYYMELVKAHPKYKPIAYSNDWLYELFADVIFGDYSTTSNVQDIARHGIFVELLILPFMHEAEANTTLAHIGHVANTLRRDLRNYIQKDRWNTVDDALVVLLDGANEFAGLLPSYGICRALRDALGTNMGVRYALSYPMKKDWVFLYETEVKNSVAHAVSIVTNGDIVLSQYVAAEVSKNLASYFHATLSACSHIDMTGARRNAYTFDTAGAIAAVGKLQLSLEARRSRTATATPSSRNEALASCSAQMRALFTNTDWMAEETIPKGTGKFESRLITLFTHLQAQCASINNKADVTEIQGLLAKTLDRLTINIRRFQGVLAFTDKFGGLSRDEFCAVALRAVGLDSLGPIKQDKEALVRLHKLIEFELQIFHAQNIDKIPSALRHTFEKENSVFRGRELTTCIMLYPILIASTLGDFAKGLPPSEIRRDFVSLFGRNTGAMSWLKHKGEPAGVTALIGLEGHHPNDSVGALANRIRLRVNEAQASSTASNQQTPDGDTREDFVSLVHHEQDEEVEVDLTDNEEELGEDDEFPDEDADNPLKDNPIVVYHVRHKVPSYISSDWGPYWREYEKTLRLSHGRKAARRSRHAEEDIVSNYQYFRQFGEMPPWSIPGGSRSTTTTTTVVTTPPAPEAYKHYYFAYGSNLSEEQVQKRTPYAKLVCRAALKDYKLTFVTYNYGWKGGVANIEKSEGDTVYGLVWSFTDDMLTKMDRFEGHPTKYRRVDVKVTQLPGINEDGSVIEGAETSEEPVILDAIAYEIVSKYDISDWQPASDKYYGQIKDGCEKFHLPLGPLEAAQKFSTENKKERSYSYSGNYWGDYDGYDDLAEDDAAGGRYPRRGSSYYSDFDWERNRGAGSSTRSYSTPTSNSGARTSSIFDPEKWHLDMSKDWWNEAP